MIKKSKMKNKRCELDGHKFDSMRELSFYKGLVKLAIPFEMQKSYIIGAAQYCSVYTLGQPKFYSYKPCTLDKEYSKSLFCSQRAKSYKSDFVVRTSVPFTIPGFATVTPKFGEDEIVIDVKPKNLTESYKKTKSYVTFLRKKKLVKKIYGIDVVVV